MGIELIKVVNDFVKINEPIFKLYYNDEEKLNEALKMYTCLHPDKVLKMKI